jgi:hypothetical protein
MTKTHIKEYTEICDNIEEFLVGLNDKDRMETGIVLCQFKATISVSDGMIDLFEPIKVLDEAKKRLIKTIDKEYLSILGELVVKESKKKKK